MSRPSRTYKVISPGRVNLIGEHTDYAYGHVMPMATDLHTELTARPASEVMIHSESASETRSFDPDEASTTGGWVDYVKGCYAVLREQGYDPGGFEGRLTNTLPVGSGLSSSASLELAVMWFLNEAYDLELERMELARLAQQVETEFVGVSCGIMDQFAVALGEENHALHLDTDSMAYESVAMPPSAQIIVFHTGVDRELRDSAYNERRETVESALQTLGVTSSQSVDESDLESLPPDQRQRLGYVIRENDRVRRASEILSNGDLERFGQIQTVAHRDIADSYEASCPELDFVVDTAVELGAYGARLTGAGWGGAAIVLVEEAEAQDVAEELLDAYGDQFPQHDARTHLVSPADGVHSNRVTDEARLDQLR